MNTPNETQPGLYADLLDDRTREAVNRTRTFAEIIAELGRGHEAHVAAVRAFEEKLDV